MNPSANPVESRLETAPRRLQKRVLDALFPPRCVACSEWTRAAFCPRCAPQLKMVESPHCARCGEGFDPLAFSAAICARCRARPPHFALARSAYSFDGPLREAIHRFKYSQKIALAPRLAPLLAEVWARDDALEEFRPQFLVAVPLHAARLRQRGFNQSALLARDLSRIGNRTWNVPVAEFLVRTRATPPQFALNRAERAKNVRGAFAVSAASHCFQDAKILLIDDVFTTGATLDECARVLRKAGAGEVCALTLARQL